MEIIVLGQARDYPEWYRECQRCQEYAHTQQEMLNACAALAMDTGISTWSVCESFFQKYHEGGHKS